MTSRTFSGPECQPLSGHIVVLWEPIFETYQTTLGTNPVRNTKECWSWWFRENATQQCGALLHTTETRRLLRRRYSSLLLKQQQTR